MIKPHDHLIMMTMMISSSAGAIAAVPDWARD
jgi:hypothetical protein